MTTFEWFGPTGTGHYNYVYNENVEELSRTVGIAGVVFAAGKACYRVHLAYHFNDLVPPNAYIRTHKYPTFAAAKRAVERKVPPLVAVLKIQGVRI